MAEFHRSTLPTHVQRARQRGKGRIFNREGSPFYWCAYYLRGKEYRESTRTADLRKAEKFLDHRMKEVGADQIGAKLFSGPQQERVTVNEILDDLIENYKQGGRRGIRREVSPQMKSHLKRVRDYFGTSRAMEVGTKDVTNFKAELKSKKKANATINRSLQLLSQAYRHAISTDPAKLSRALQIDTLDESGNVRKGKFTPAEAELVASSLPPYMAEVARFAYETGARANEILQLRWTNLDGDGIFVPEEITKIRESRSIVLTEELQGILDRRRHDLVRGCDLIFHHDGRRISDYRKCWHTACVANGLAAYYCRDCRNALGGYISVLDAKHNCQNCRKHCQNPKYIGKLFHDFRRSAAHEMWKAGNSIHDCMKVTGHKTEAMFKRYADLFTKEEERTRQREVQQRRREWRKVQSTPPVTKSAVQ